MTMELSRSDNLSSNQLINYCLHLADNALILGHRNSEWCGHGPILEQDIAISNISLDLIGHARNFYQYAAQLINQTTNQPVNLSTEDTLAYFRDAPDFKNILLVEQPNGDWAETILRQFFFSAYQYLLFEKLQESKDEQISAIATKSLKEITYHRRWSSEWIIRLGDGTEESRERMVKAIDNLWNYTDEMFVPAAYESQMANKGICPDVALLKQSWVKRTTEVFDEATLVIPASSKSSKAGKEGNHSSHLTDILKELQSVARVHPAASW